MRRNHIIAAAGICLAPDHLCHACQARGQARAHGPCEAYWVVVIERFSAYGLLGFLLSFLLPGGSSLACVVRGRRRSRARSLAGGDARSRSRLPGRAAKGGRRHRRRSSSPRRFWLSCPGRRPRRSQYRLRQPHVSAAWRSEIPASPSARAVRRPDWPPCGCSRTTFRPTDPQPAPR